MQEQEMKIINFTMSAMLMLGATTLSAEEEMSKEELAKMSQNPVGNMYNVPLEYWGHNGLGPNGDGSTNMAILKPAIPVNLGSVNVINRFILPYVVSDPFSGGDFGEINIPSSSTKESGLGNLQYQAIVSPTEPGAIIYGLGAMFEFPTHSGSLGSDNYSAGPVLLILSMPGNWVFGSLIQNLWSIGGTSDPEQEVNSLAWQYFINYNFDNGWYLTTTPTMTADWTAESGEQWTVPLGGGVGKLTKFESFPPLDLKLQAFSNVIHPTGAADWQVMFGVKVILPKQMFQ